MLGSPLRLIKRWQPHLPSSDLRVLPANIRGIYVLYKYRPRSRAWDVVYVGLARTSVRSRLRSHRRKKKGLWTHASIFEVWDNVREDEVVELEGLLRQIYAHDQRANRLNKQRGFKKLRRLDLILGSSGPGNGVA